MIFWFIIEGIVGALICAFICGGWYLLDCWIDDISTRRWRKKMDKQSEQKEEKNY